jgi:LacI family transcriptional regulator
VATIRDVARAAGVSIATVSRVFNGSHCVSDGTRRRVQTAAARLDYWPNVAARTLTTSRTHALGVLLPDLYGDFFSDIIHGIDQAAHRSQYQILLASSHADAHDLLTAIRSMRGRIDGLIAMASDRRSAIAIAQIARYFPVVLLNPCSRLNAGCSVSVTNHQGAYAMIEHLLRLGHTQVGVIKGPVGNGDAEQRLRGYRKALRDAGIEPHRRLAYEGDFTERSGYRAALEIVRRSPRPSALFATNDCMAVGVLSALREAGIEVPDEMAVTGFDDIAVARYLSPPLTTVRVDAYELGQRAIELWVQRSADPLRRRHDVLPTTLVVRRSCGSKTPLDAADRREGRRRPSHHSNANSDIDLAAGPSRSAVVRTAPSRRRTSVSHRPGGPSHGS